MTLTYENVRVRLGGREVLKGVSLETAPGLITGIVGPNGCGKSTLLKTTFGLCRREGGRVLADGRPVEEMGGRALAARVGYVSQEAACVFDFSVSQVVEMALYARRDRGLSRREVVDGALAELGISHLGERSMLSLSGGERKLVFLARAVAQGAETVLLDEPTNHLDIRHQLFLMDYLRHSGRTVLIVLHDLRLAAHYCHRLCLLSQGEVVIQGDPEAVLTRAVVRQVFGVEGCACQTPAGQEDFRLFF